MQQSSQMCHSVRKRCQSVFSCNVCTQVTKISLGQIMSFFPYPITSWMSLTKGLCSKEGANPAPFLKSQHSILVLPPLLQ